MQEKRNQRVHYPQGPLDRGMQLTTGRDRPASGFWYRSQSLCPKGRAMSVYRTVRTRRLKALIIENGQFDQLIDYGTFLHVSYKRIGQNRHQRLKKGGAGYELD